MVSRAWLAAWLVAAACYKPAPRNGALLCSSNGQCPQGYHCAADSTCWRDGSDPGADPGPGVDGGGVDAVPFSQAPAAISPRNGATTGSVHAAMSRRPLFRWRPLPEATSYQLQIDDSCDPVAFRDCGFASPEADELATTATWRLSTGLGVATSSPPGRRYYWRVRGCGADQCTPWSEIRYLDVGRNPSDFDGDGNTDLVIGNANAAVNGTDAVGSAYFARGATDEPGPAGLVTMVPSNSGFGEGFGIATASAGDVDGDGLSDLLIGAEPGPQSGRVYLYRNAPGLLLPQLAQTVLNPDGIDHTGRFGHALAGGDLDGDGHSDVVIGAESQDQTGKVFVFAGTAAATGIATQATWTLDNPAHQDQGGFGNALAIGDFDGDGYADLAVAASQQDAVGRVFVYRGGPHGIAARPTASLDDPAIDTNAFFGNALAAGDFDGDGYADLAVAAYAETIAATPGVGRVFVFHGGPGGIADRAAPWRTLDNPTGQPSSLFGWAVVAADFNADDVDDLAVSALGQDIQAGRVYIYRGTTTGLPDQPSQTLDDPAPTNDNDGFGYVMATGDRAPADGIADLFIGAPRDTGTIYLFGGTTTGFPGETTSAITGPRSGIANGIGPSSLSSAPP